jgi:predicted TIM-barrel fold metal-dependent hydrolase
MSASGSFAPIIDACVHPVVRESSTLLSYMPEPWRTRPIPSPHRYLYPAPTGEPPYGEFLLEARATTGLPGSDPELVRAHLRERGVDVAVLVPLTRGLVPDVDLGSIICSATNDWLVENWLEAPDREVTFRGSIRINPHDPEGAVREIERMADTPRMVQIAVPLEAHAPYGQRRYLPIWEAAAHHGLPVAIHSDGGAGVDFPPTPNGYPLSYAEYLALMPLNFIYHLSSLAAEGVFERVPGLRVVFGDGGHDLCHPLMWRMDEDWAPTRIEVPWVPHVFSEYLEEHVRFCASRLEGPLDDDLARRWVAQTDAGRLLLYASNYPHWTTLAPGELHPEADDAVRGRLLHENAVALYGERLALPADAAAPR